MNKGLEKRREKLLAMTNVPELREEIDALITDLDRARAKNRRRKEALRVQNNAFNFKNNRIRNLEAEVKNDEE